MNKTLAGNSGINRGVAVVVVLNSPREKYWGVLEEINQAGVLLRGLDLNAFDDWVRAIIHNEPFIGFGDLFFPMWRVERVSRDEAGGGVPSLCDEVEKRTGHTIEELLQADNQNREPSRPGHCEVQSPMSKVQCQTSTRDPDRTLDFGHWTLDFARF
jgi:hypothetical protein